MRYQRFLRCSQRQISLVTLQFSQHPREWSDAGLKRDGTLQIVGQMQRRCE